MIQFFTKCIFIILLVLVGTLGVTDTTLAYFYDTVTADTAVITAGVVDFRLTRTVFDAYVGKEYEGEKRTVTVAVPETNSMDMQYFVAMENLTPTTCDQFTVRVKRNENLVYEGLVSNFTAATTTDFGTWDFAFDLPLSATLTHGDLCAANFVFTAWSDTVPSTAVSGFYNIETLTTKLRAKTVVMNEVLADPNTSAVYPANREFIELKNIGTAAVDVAGFAISEISGSTEVRRVIVASSTSVGQMMVVGGSTIIPAGGYAVVVFHGNGSFLNNGGDTIRFFGSVTSTSALDVYTYETSLNGKSDARLPDGIGSWVDPIPTPGTPNAATVEDLEKMGWSEIEIADVLGGMYVEREIDAPIISVDVSNPSVEATTSESITPLPPVLDTEIPTGLDDIPTNSEGDIPDITTPASTTLESSQDEEVDVPDDTIHQTNAVDIKNLEDVVEPNEEEQSEEPETSSMTGNEAIKDVLALESI